MTQETQKSSASLQNWSSSQENFTTKITGNIYKLLSQTLHKKVQSFHVLHTKWSYMYNLIFNNQTLCFKMTLTELKKNYRSKHVPSKCKEQSMKTQILFHFICHGSYWVCFTEAVSKGVILLILCWVMALVTSLQKAAGFEGLSL